MTLLAFDPPRTHDSAMALRLDRASFALLRALASGGAAYHPVFGGTLGREAFRRLVDQSAITADGSLLPTTVQLLTPLRRPTNRLVARISDPTARCRTIWSTSSEATVATHRDDGTVMLRSCAPTAIGSELVTWLGVRPLPEPPRRSTWSGPIDDPRFPLTHVHWSIERICDKPRSRSTIAAIDAGHDGWRLARQALHRDGTVARFEPVGISEIYLALSHLI